MAGELHSAGAANSFPDWTLVFAREPEPDMDLELDESGGRSQHPSSVGAPAPQRPPRVKILILIFLLLVVAGGAYVAMDPEMVMKLMGQAQPVPAPTTSTPRPVRPLASPTVPPARTAEEGSGSIAAPGIVPTPLFAEGDLVSVLPNPVSPVMSLSLSQDAAGTRPGPTVSTGATLRVLDAELHENTWVYLVRSDAGMQGWIAEKQLLAKP